MDKREAAYQRACEIYAAERAEVWHLDEYTWVFWWDIREAQKNYLEDLYFREGPIH